MSVSVTKRIRSGAMVAIFAAILITGCGRKSQLPGQTGTPLPTTTSTSTTTTSVPLGNLNPPTTIVATGPEVVMGQAPAAQTITITAGVFSPATLTVHVGEPVTFVGGDSTAYNVSVGNLDPQTVTPNLVETYAFRAPGTVTVTQDFNKDTATITVIPALPQSGPTTATTFPDQATTTTSTTTTPSELVPPRPSDRAARSDSDTGGMADVHQCPFCELRFLNLSELQQHIAFEHPDRVLPDREY